VLLRNLSDLNVDGMLDGTEFRIAMHLVYGCLGGATLPTTVPQSLIQSARLPIGSKVVTPASTATVVTTATTNPDININTKINTNAVLHTLSQMTLPTVESLNLDAYSNTTATSAAATTSSPAISSNETTPTSSKENSPTLRTPEDIARNRASKLLLNVFQLLEEGQFSKAMPVVDEALSLLSKFVGVT
jgi:hypothetical protein